MSVPPIRICLAGVTGAVGRALLPAVVDAPDMTLAGATSRRAAGQDAGLVIGEPKTDVLVSADLEVCLRKGVDVLIDYTTRDVSARHLELALSFKVPVVLGTTGFSEADFRELDALARKVGIGVVTGNFALTAALLQHFALFAARYIPHFEIMDICKADKPDVPSGTARELAEKLSEVTLPRQAIPISDLEGEPASRGATINGVQCHSLRLPGYASSVEAIFGMPGERLSLRHECISHGEPFVNGSLLAARKLAASGDDRITGVVRGLDELLFKNGAGLTD